MDCCFSAHTTPYMPIHNPNKYHADTQLVKYSQIHRDAPGASKLITGKQGSGGRQTDLGNQTQDVNNTIGTRNTTMILMELH